MACQARVAECRGLDIAPKLTDARPDGDGWKARCPVCGHDSFRIGKPGEARLRHIWGCACKTRCGCRRQLRAALLGLGIMAGCLGSFDLASPAVRDQMADAAMREAVDLILRWPGLDPSRIRLILAEARGDKFPESYGEFAKFAQEIGIGRRHSYNMAAEFCRPADQSSSPEGGS